MNVKILSRNAAARYIGVPEGSLHRLLKSGHLNIRREAPDGRIFFHVADLDQVMAKMNPRPWRKGNPMIRTELS